MELKAFPAHAGMNRHHARSVQAICRVPRTRGDEPILAQQVVPDGTRSPHTRG